MRRLKYGISILALALLIGSIMSVTNFQLQATNMKSAIDDGPLGEKIVDIEAGSSNTLAMDLYYAITEHGEVYAWGDNSNGLLGNGTQDNNPTPKKVLAPEGSDQTFLNNVVKIYTSRAANGGKSTFARTRDGSIYAWGNNAKGQLGLPEKKVYTLPTKVSFAFSVKDIQAFDSYVFILSNEGNVYVCGDGNGMTLGFGYDPTDIDEFRQITTDINGDEIPPIKQVAISESGKLLLAENGTIYGFGISRSVGTGKPGFYSQYPELGVLADDSPISNIDNIIEMATQGTAWVQTKNGDQYYADDFKGTIQPNGASKGNARYTLLNESLNIVDNDNVLQKIKYINNLSVGNVFVTSDKRIYRIVNYNSSGFKGEGNSYTEPYSYKEIPAGYNNAKKAIGGYRARGLPSTAYILSESGGVYVDGEKVAFGDIIVTGKKTTNTPYQHNEKYNDTISLEIATSSSTIDNVRFHETDLLTGSKVENQTTSGTINVTILEGERVHRQYDFYIEGQEDFTTTSFTIDLYKKAVALSDISDNGLYQQGKTITFNYNGLTTNTISATLSKDGATATAYTSGTAINDVGTYILVVTDQYGNSATYNFEITDVPVAESIVFTKSASGELIYDNIITKANNIIGSLSLTYPTGQPTSTIKTLVLGTTGDAPKFEVVNTNQLKVKNQLNAGTYKVLVSGVDQNDMPYSGEITIVILQATQTMAWNDASLALKTNGTSLGATFTLGVKDKLGSASVTYSVNDTTCANINDKTGFVTITCIPPSGSLTFTATPDTDINYKNEAITLSINVTQKSITAKTLLRDGTDYKSNVTIKLGSSKPDVKVELHDETIDTSTWGTPTFTFTKNGIAVANPQNEVGTYSVTATYPSGEADNYSFTWESATLIVENITIDDTNKNEYYTLTSGGSTYTQGTWTKNPIIITPKHETFNLMKVNNTGSVSSSAYTYTIEGDNTVTLTFENADGASVATTIHVKYDATAPTITNFDYTNSRNALRAILRALTFDRYFDEEKKVSFHGNDGTGSGIKEFTYEIDEITEEGTIVSGTKKSGSLTTSQSVTLSKNKNYKIAVKAIDHVGNIGTEKIETVKIDETLSSLKLTATSNGNEYDGTNWVPQAIQIQLETGDVSNVERYLYSTDGNTFTAFTSTNGTITLPNPLANVNNVTYTFKVEMKDGKTSTTTLPMKVDKDKPVIEVSGTVNGSPYTGGKVDQDVTLVPSQEIENISGITYYYTTVDASANGNPMIDSNWKQYTGTLTTGISGTYHFKGVSGAGLLSDTVSMSVEVEKKIYTDIRVDVTTEGKTYTPATWAKGDVTFKLAGGFVDETQITGYEVCETTGERPSASCTWKPVSDKVLKLSENVVDKTYWFRVNPVDTNGKISNGIHVKLDVDQPVKPTFQIEEVNQYAFAKFVNFMSFGEWMKAGVKVTIVSNDVTSGIDKYTYVEKKENGNETKSSKNGVLFYNDETNHSITAIAYDKAGNQSIESLDSGKIMIDQKPPVIEGVKDQGEYKQYYVPRFVKITDAGSGLKHANYHKNDGVIQAIVNGEQSFRNTTNKEETYVLKAEDKAGNIITITFKIVPLPNIDLEIDGSDESKDIIDQIQNELNEVKDKLTENESKDYEEWIKDATDRWNELRKGRVEHGDTGSVVEGTNGTTFDPRTELIVEELDEESVPVLPRRALHIYDVYLKKGNVIIQPDGSVKVYLPYTEEAQPIVYEIKENGNIKEMPVSIEHGYVVFVTNTLETYAISNEDQKENKDPSHCVVGPDGALGTDDDVCGNGNGSDDPQKNPDGSVDVPPNGSITFPNGNEIETPDGGHINPDGSVILPNGDVYDPQGNKKPTVCVVGPDGKENTSDDVCGNGNGSDNPIKKPDGSVEVPPNGSIVFPGGDVLPTPEGGIIHPDGSVTLPNGDQYHPDGSKKEQDDSDINIDSNQDGKPDVNVDINCDGKADINIDTNGDGIPDINIDTTGDGKPNYNVDTNGDGKADVNIGPVRNPWSPDLCVNNECGTTYCTDSYYKPFLNIDTDGDGRPDLNLDIDGDMEADLNIDVDGDMIPDVNIDSTGDGKADINIDDDNDGKADRNIATIKEWIPNKNVDGVIPYDTMSNIKLDPIPSDDRDSEEQGNGGNEGEIESQDNKTAGERVGASTGDTTNIVLWWILVVINACILLYAFHKKRLKMKKASG